MFKSTALKKSYIVGFTLLLLIVSLAIIFQGNLFIKLTPPKPVLSEGWYLKVDDEQVAIENYPVRINVDAYEHYTIYKMVEASNQPLHLLLYTNHQDVVIRLDDVIIYNASQEPYSMSHYANLHHVVSIDPDESVSKELSLTFHSPYDTSSGVISPIYESNNSSGILYSYIIFQHMWSILFGALFIVIGIVILAISHVVDHARLKGRFYLAFFAILFGGWIIARATLLQFVTNNTYLLGGLQFTLFIMLPMPLLMYYKSSVTERFEQEMLWMTGIFGLQAIVVTLLQIFGILDFVKPILFVAITFILGMIILLVLTVIEVASHNDNAKKFSRYYGVLFLYGIVVFASEYTGGHDQLPVYGLAVLAILAIIVFLDYIFFIEKRIGLSYLSENYAKLAYIDRLTGAKNRHAYEEDFERFFENKLLRENLRLVFFDFDGLKQINDQYGHAEGDHVLKEGCACIMNAFGRYGDCYRIGGDEFACMIQSIDDNLYKQCQKQLINDINAISAYHKYNLRISIGTATYSNEVTTPNDMIRKADKNMYENKSTHRST